MTLEDLIRLFRLESDDKVRDVDGQSDDLFWSDEAVADWLTEAELEAAIRKRLLFEDTRADMCLITVTSGSSSYTLHPAWFEITGAFLARTGSTDYCRLHATDRDELDGLCPNWRFERYEPGAFIQDDTRIVLPGRVQFGYTLRLEGYRVPLEPLKNDGDEPEIAQVHHRMLVQWALHRAYGVQDADSFDPQRSDKALAKFVQYFGLRPDADLRKDARANHPHHNVAW